MSIERISPIVELQPRMINRIKRMADNLHTATTIAHKLELPIGQVRKVLHDYGVMNGGAPKRCPDCGAKVIPPCRHCRLERQVALARAGAASAMTSQQVFPDTSRSFLPKVDTASVSPWRGSVSSRAFAASAAAPRKAAAQTAATGPTASGRCAAPASGTWPAEINGA